MPSHSGLIHSVSAKVGDTGPGTYTTIYGMRSLAYHTPSIVAGRYDVSESICERYCHIKLRIGDSAWHVVGGSRCVAVAVAAAAGWLRAALDESYT